MKKLMILSLAFAGGLMATSETGYAHGGQYRGPGDVVPPNPGGGGRTPRPSGPSTPGPSGPSTPGPSGPATPGPAGPATGGPAAPAPTAGPTTGRRGAPVAPDLTRWQFWWEFNKDPFINLKEAIHANLATTGGDEFFMGSSKRAEAKDTLKPTKAEILNRILPALKRALDSTDQRDITSSCLVAMAKIGMNSESPQINILEEMKKRLTSGDQEIRETAALAMGISQMPDATQYLVDLSSDTAAGRKLCGRAEVDDRTRSFASYGLGLIAHATSDADLKTTIFDSLKKQLEDKSIVNRNIKVAVINAIRLLRPNPANGPKEKKLLDDVLGALWTYYTASAGQGEQQIQSHVPPAIANLLGKGGDEAGTYKDYFAKLLNGSKKYNNNMYQSAAIALGLLAESQEKVKGDKKYSDALLTHSQKGKDQQSKHFCLMALAKIGGTKNRNELLKAFNKGNKAIVKPWAAISLGVLAFEAFKAAGDGAAMDVTIGETLHRALKDIKNPETLAAIAVSLGLSKYRDAADDLQNMLVRNKHKDELAGYLAISLALMSSQRSVDDIRNIVTTSTRRPDLLKQAAIALGKLGDKTVADVLLKILNEPEKNVAKLSAVASALAYIGDRRTIDPLADMLFDESITELSRAFAAVALGGVADKENLPWNSKIGGDMNYRAAVETLTNGVAGILDIL